MKNSLFFTGLLIMLGLQAFGQDTLFLKDGRKYYGFITEVGILNLKAVPATDINRPPILFQYDSLFKIKTTNPFVRYRLGLEKKGSPLIDQANVLPTEYNYAMLSSLSKVDKNNINGLSANDWEKLVLVRSYLRRATVVNRAGWIATGAGVTIWFSSLLYFLTRSSSIFSNNNQKVPVGIYVGAGITGVGIGALYTNSLFTRKPAYRTLQSLDYIRNK